MTHKQIEASREIRLWIGTIIVPAMTFIGTMAMIPEVRKSVTAKAKVVTQSIKNKIKSIKFKKMKP
jgi:hypothetical protein